MMRTIVGALSGLLVSITVLPARAEAAEDAPTASENDGWHVSLELDPTPFLMSGWSIGAGVKPAGLRHWKFVAQGVAARFPGFIASVQGNSGWSERVTGGFAIAQYFPADDRRGLHIGAAAGAWDWSLTPPNAPNDRADAAYVELFALIGYQWFVPHTGIFISPDAMLAVPVKVAGSTYAPASGQSFKQSPIIPFAALNVGYEF
jgi:hypothetical protein